MANDMLPMIDTKVPIDELPIASKRMESRHVFHKTGVGF